MAKYSAKDAQDLYPIGFPNIESCDMSFSGFQTAIETHFSQDTDTKNLTFTNLTNICSSYQAAVFSHVSKQTHRALDHLILRKKLEIKQVHLCGGVACNRDLKRHFQEISEMYGVELLQSDPQFCVDNAAMIAWSAWENLNAGHEFDLMCIPEKVMAFPDMPVGSYIEDTVNIKSKTLRNMR